MISLLLIAIFVIGYAAIAFEYPLRLNKAASALLTGVLCWTVYILSENSYNKVVEELLHHFSEISSILFFLLGAMTIVELIDSHNGFEMVTSRIKTKSKRKLLVIVSIITFFLSAILDNLTTAIVMTSLSAKLLPEKEDRFWFAGMIVIAANAGGAWSPLGDVTTTMLWIGGQITALNIIIKTFLPSLAVLCIPLLITSFHFKGKFLDSSQAGILKKKSGQRRQDHVDFGDRVFAFCTGI
jgi:Na+/H+ antiporter NhaD/arsenite permease-like protein